MHSKNAWLLIRQSSSGNGHVHGIVILIFRMALSFELQGGLRIRHMLEKVASALGDTEPASLNVVSIVQALLVAERLSFRQAASALGLRQSAVSRRVRSLEDALGVSLFERHSGGVRITAAGARFLDHARSALAQIDHAAKIAGSAGRGERGQLQIGICSSIATGFLYELIRTFHEQHPNVLVHICEFEARDHASLIRNGGLDIAFIMGAAAAANNELTPLWTERLFAALPLGHALCAKKEIKWEALRDESFIIRESGLGPATHEYLARRFAKLGRIPSVQRFDVGREACMQLVALGFGVTLTSEATTANCFPGVAFRPIGGSSGIVRFSGIWSSRNDNPAFRRFLSLARTLSKKRNYRIGDVSGSSLAMATR